MKHERKRGALHGWPTFGSAREEFILIFQEARAHCVERTCAGAGLTRDEQIRFENRRAFHETLARRLREARKRS